MRKSSRHQTVVRQVSLSIYRQHGSGAVPFHGPPLQRVGEQPPELSVEERNLLSVAYGGIAGNRRAAWRIIANVEQEEKTKGNKQQALYVKASVFCSVSARSRHFVNVDVIYLPSVCDSFCVSTFSLGQGSRSFCHELYEQSTVMFCWSGRDACFYNCLYSLCRPCFLLYREFNSFVFPFCSACKHS